MGFESFQVELCGGNASAREAENEIMALENISEDHDSIMVTGSSYFLMRDGRHAIEMELTHSPIRISCRFTVCHPPSVDAVFLDLVRRLMEMFDMKVSICDDVTPDDARNFSLAEFDDFARSTLRYIELRRREWRGAFGDQQLGATTAELHEHILLPLCQTPVEKAG